MRVERLDITIFDNDPPDYTSLLNCALFANDNTTH